MKVDHRPIEACDSTLLPGIPRLAELLAGLERGDGSRIERFLSAPPAVDDLTQRIGGPAQYAYHDESITMLDHRIIADDAIKFPNTLKVRKQP